MSGMLPKGWMEVSIGEIAFVSLGKTPSKKDYLSNGSLKVIKFRDVNNGVVDFFNDKTGFVRVDEAVVTSMTELKMWDVLTTSAAHSGENIGKKTAIVTELPEKFERVFFTGELLNVRIPNHFLGFEIVSKMIYYFLSSEAGYKGIQKAVAGVHLTQGRAKGILFPLPPLNEQKRIVAKVDAIMPRIDSAKERLEKIPAILKRFRQSVLTAAVTGKLTEKWREEHPETESAEVLLDEKLRMRKQYYASYWKDFEIPQRWICALLKNIADLRLGKMLDGSKNKGISMRYLRNINVRWFGFDLESLKEIRITQAEKESLSIKTGDVFVCEGGEPGRSAVWKAKENNMTFQKALHRVRMKISFLPDLLVYNLKVDADTKKLDELFTGSTIKHFTGRSLAVYPVAIPPLEEQKEIVRQVDKLFALADKVEEHYQKAWARVDALSQSVLAKAFRGELVPQDPDDEPAEKLLQRIREEKEKMENELKNASRSARGTRRNGAKMQHTRPEEKQAGEP